MAKSNDQNATQQPVIGRLSDL